MEKSYDVTKNNQGPLRPVHPAIEEYILGLLKSHDERVLVEMEQLAKHQNFPIVGRMAGAFLEVLALSIGATRIFEFGSGYGYSAFWFSRAVGPNGKVICTDGDLQNKERALQFIAQVNRLERVQFHHGWAQEVFKKTEGTFDLIYNDVDKIDYPEVWTLAKDRLRSGGLYIADNVLWSGRVTMQKVENDLYPGWTEAIQKHNQMIAEDKNFDFFINPIRDGLIVARKK